MVHRGDVLAEILIAMLSLSFPSRLNEKKGHTVSLNVLPKPVASGAMRSMRNVTRKRLICSWSMKMSTVSYTSSIFRSQ